MMIMQRGTNDYHNVLDQEAEAFLSNQERLALAYTVRDLIEPLIQDGTKLSFEQANGFTCSYYTMRRLFNRMDNDVSSLHEELVEFYGLTDDRELSNECDRLRWFYPDEENMADGDKFSDVPF